MAISISCIKVLIGEMKCPLCAGRRAVCSRLDFESGRKGVEVVLKKVAALSSASNGEHISLSRFFLFRDFKIASMRGNRYETGSNCPQEWLMRTKRGRKRVNFFTPLQIRKKARNRRKNPPNGREEVLNRREKTENRRESHHPRCKMQIQKKVSSYCHFRSSSK